MLSRGILPGKTSSKTCGNLTWFSARHGKSIYICNEYASMYIYRIYLEQVPAVWRFNYTVVVSQEKLYFQLNEIPYLGKRTVVPLMKERTAVFYPVWVIKK